IVGQRTIPVQKSNRYPKLTPILRTQDGTRLLTVSGRALSYIDRDVPNRAPYHPDQLTLGVSSNLAVQSAYHPAHVGNGVIVLHERSGNSGIGETGLTPGL